MTALIKREYLEHRGAFLYAPGILLALFTLLMGSALAFNKWRPQLEIETPTTLKFFEVAFLGVSLLWFVYLMIALFFYYADAFNADRRNNAMLFWKSMPVSDFTMLGSKMLAGLTLFPLLILAMIGITGIVLYGFSAAAVIALPGLELPNIVSVISSAAQIGFFAVVFIATALLWYAPFFAWVGALSTLVGRWSIPLAFLVPGLLVLGENLFFRGVAGLIGDFLIPGSQPRGGYILSFLAERAEFADEGMLMRTWFRGDEPFSATVMIGDLVAGIDWTQMAAGLIFTAVVVYLASEYRRRVIIA
jgi:ABC-2 type transport system permease protein